jgi:periplasmic divalent cation tolerance protein
MSDVRVVLCNCSPDEAHSLAETLVSEGLVACVNILSGVTSYYMWDGAMQADNESTLLMKTVADRLDALESRLVELHSYDTPEIIALHPSHVFAPYADWVAEVTA